MKKYFLLSVLVTIVLTSCGNSGQLTLASDSNVGEDIPSHIDKLGIVGIGDHELVSDVYEIAFPEIQKIFEEEFDSKVESYYVNSGVSADFEKLNTRIVSFRPQYVLQFTPYVTISGGLRIKSVDVRLIKFDNFEVVWRGYVDMQMTGSKKLSEAALVLPEELEKLLYEDGIL